MNLFLKFFIFLIIFCILSSQLSEVSASQPRYLNDIELKSLGFTSYESINPNLLIYPLKRISENIKLKLIFNKQKKKEYLYQLYEIRLRELVYIINNRKEGFLLFTADRYNSFVGVLKMENVIDQDLKLQIESKVKILERLRDIYPANSENWTKLQQTIATTKSLI